MSSESASPQPSSAGEQSGLERIREVALKIFAAHGAEGTSLRMIAEAAEVSIGLVQHHFGTKGHLMTALDEYVMTVLGESLAGPLPSDAADPVAEVAQRVTSLVADHIDVIDYMCRAIVDATPMGVRLFDELVEIGRGHWAALEEQGLTSPDVDPVWMAINPMVLVLGIFIVRSHLDRHLTDTFTTPTQLDRWQKATDALIRRGQLRSPDRNFPGD
jgi:AcrR family transcriptional regulator